MSGQQIGTVVGAVIGAYFGMPQLGAAIGGLIGGAIDPDVIKAPSIGDAQKQTSQPGVPRPVVYGHPAPFAGNIIDGEHKARKIKVKERQGKGGPVVVSERFLLTTAIRICEGPIAGVVRIWRNGEVVYDRRAVEDLPAFGGGSPADVLNYAAAMRAKTVSFQEKVRIYLGDETQLPDPALEAIHGVGNTPYYRGTAYIVIEDDDVTDTRGSAAQYQFEVLAVGTEVSVSNVMDDYTPEIAAPYWPVRGVTGGGGANIAAFNATSSIDLPTLYRVHINARDVGTRDGTFARAIHSINGTEIWDSGWVGNPAYQASLDTLIGTTYARPDLVGPISAAPLAPVTFRHLAPVTVDVVQMYASLSFGNFDSYSHFQYPDPAEFPAEYTQSPELPDVFIGSDGELYAPSWNATPLDSIGALPTTLASVVDDIAARCNVPPSRIDTAALTDIIPGFLVAQQFSGADAIRPTQQAFFYDLPELDGIKAIKRGAAAVVAIDEDDLLEATEDEERVRGQAIEFPLKVSVVVQDPAAEYAAIPQTSGRLSPDFPGSSEIVVQLPIPFDADTTARIAHKLHKVLHSAAEGRIELALPQEFSRYIPADAFTYRDRRWLIEEARYVEGVCRWRAVYDRVSNYTSVVTGRPAEPPELPSTGLKGPTLFAAMNLPQLRTQDNTPGLYVAAVGTFTDWPGADIELSVDGGITFQTVLQITSPATMGALTSAITASGTPLEVAVRGELESVTVEQIAARANAFAVGLTTFEVGQFQTATLTSAGAVNEYDLTTLTRGLLGTTAAAHSIGDRFVLLDSAVYFLPIDSIHAGKTLIFRPVTLGSVPANNVTYSVYYDPATYFIDGGEVVP